MVVNVVVVEEASFEAVYQLECLRVTSKLFWMSKY